MKKLTCSYADTCLPDYWGGHHLAHICIPVWKNMPAADLRSAMHSEVNQDAVAGSAFPAGDIPDWWCGAAHKAIDEVEIRADPLFPSLEETEEDSDISVYAYFVFVEEEDDE